MSPIAEVSKTVVSMVDDPVEVVNLLNKNATPQEPEVQTVDDNCENYVEHQAFMEPKDSTIPVQSTHDNMPSFDFMGLRPCVALSNHVSSLPNKKEAAKLMCRRCQRQEHSR